MTHARLTGLAAALLVCAASTALADTIEVPKGASVQDALDAAEPGDVLQLEKGTYRGDLDFGGKAVTVRGIGAKTVLRGTGTGPVVRFTTDEGADSVLDSVTVRGGLADRGGGIAVIGADPVIVRCVITRNRARSQGSGIYLASGSRALVFNNLITFNRRRGSGDPHAIEIVDASPTVVNNTVSRSDSNAVILRGVAAATIANNVLAYNGSTVGRKLRGRGICDFSGNRATIRGNLFHANRVGALLRGGKDYRRVAKFQNSVSDPLVADNRDGAPRFRRAPPSAARLSRAHHFRLRGSSRARDRGLAAFVCNDLDGTRNDAGHTGGMHAGPATTLPAANACGR